MNKRIQELMIKAIYDVDRIYDPIDNPLNDEVSKMYIPDCFAEKFAELIVRECLTTIKQDRYRHSKDLETDYDDGYVDGLGRAEKILEEHFGVEE